LKNEAKSLNLVPRRLSSTMRLPVILLVAAFALAGCNANQTVNPSSQRALGYSPYNPIEYAQTSGSYGGGHGGR
jgi:hypothetical protein